MTLSVRSIADEKTKTFQIPFAVLNRPKHALQHLLCRYGLPIVAVYLQACTKTALWTALVTSLLPLSTNITSLEKLNHNIFTNHIIGGFFEKGVWESGEGQTPTWLAIGPLSFRTGAAPGVELDAESWFIGT
ncbi:hypothetical protein BELL_0010g00230 [Botrytis elliptica]|uniref:Uncharacterized protein n=1 Tax=Botrytis elliptica TaxID=278938 RepID=A0A4Z1KGJ8_9HELO|nr:hypothetical protein BELL_0010g00230 [Botrytis elliptica]